MEQRNLEKLFQISSISVLHSFHHLSVKSVSRFFLFIQILILDSLSDPDEQAANGAVLFLNIILKHHEIQTEAEMSQFVKSLLVKLRLVRGQQRSKCHAGILSLFVIAANQQPVMTINKLLENRDLFQTNIKRLRVVQTQVILFLKSMSESGDSDIERL